MYATAYAFGGPDSSSSPRLDPTRGRNIGSKSLDAVSRGLAALLRKLRKTARRYGYRGLKIFTSLSLRFQDFQRTKNLRAVQLLLGHTKLESTVRYLGIEVDDALEISEQTEI